MKVLRLFLNFGLQLNLGYRTILFSTKSVFDQNVGDFDVSDFEQIRVTTQPREAERTEHAMMLHPSAF